MPRREDETTAGWRARAAARLRNYQGDGGTRYHRDLQADMAAAMREDVAGRRVTRQMLRDARRDPFSWRTTAAPVARLRWGTTSTSGSIWDPAPTTTSGTTLRQLHQRMSERLEETRREDGPMPVNMTRDAYGRTRDSGSWNPFQLPQNYPRNVCTCTSCVRAFLNDYGVPRSTFDADFYQEDSGRRAFSYTYFATQGVGDPAGHRPRPSRWSAYEHEAPFPRHFEGLINVPLKYILRRSGRVWSAEVEINELDTRRCADLLGVRASQYSYRPDRASIVASSDATTDAEIKISCMRDGSTQHAQMARDTYTTLFDNGARVAHNAGHHVHVDGTRLADAGLDIATSVSRAAHRLLALTRAALTPLATSGYKQHRGSSAYWDDGSVMHGRQAFHASRLYAAARSSHDQNATLEYRLPNATLWPIRAQSYVAVPLAALDWAERAVMDEDSKAIDQLRQVNDRTASIAPFDEVTAASFLLECCNFSKDSRKALAIAAFTSPASKKHVAVWESAAEFARGLSSLDTEARELVTVTAKSKTKRAADTEPRELGDPIEHPDEPLPIPPTNNYDGEDYDPDYGDDDDYDEED